MQLVRYRKPGEPVVRWGWHEADQIGELVGTPFDTYRRRDADLRTTQLELLPPIQPGKIVCVGRNYAEHAAEHGSEVPELPLLFLKPPSSVIAAGAPILIPPQSEQVEHEGELAIVIGRSGRWLEPDDVDSVILGYTIANDVTARDLQRADGQWTRSKGFDSFCPLGPWIETDFDPIDALIQCSVNGQLRQMASTRDMVFPVKQLVAFISSVMTLEPGDLILTGTPSGVGRLQAGDEVTVEIDGIGALTNPVKTDDQAKRLG